MLKNLLKGGVSTNQRAQGEGSLKRATFWMQDPVLRWLKSYAKVSGISQGALINAIILDFQLRKLDPATTDPAKVAGLRRYVDILLGGCPPMQPAPQYRVAHHAAPRQFPKMTK